jgi:hypothetical protein
MSFLSPWLAAVIKTNGDAICFDHRHPMFAEELLTDKIRHMKKISSI